MNNTMKIFFASDDWEGIRKLMRVYSGETFAGRNEDNEDMIIDCYSDRIETTTFQTNGWTRTNIYHEDGFVEELFD